MKKRKSAAIVLIIIVCMGAGFAYMFNHRPTSLTPAPPVPQPAKPPVAGTPVKIFKVSITDNQPKLKSVDATVTTEKRVEEATLTHFIEQGDSGDASNLIPRGTKLLSLKIQDGLASVNLSKEFRDNFSGGSENEALLVGAILRTMGQFPQIKRVQLLVEGKALDSLGHLDLSEPLDVNSVGSDFGGES